MNIKNRYLRFLYWRLRDVRQTALNYYALGLIHIRMLLPHRSEPHALSQEVIVSLTTYHKRFPTLHLTLECLLRQSVRPDRIVVWINEVDLAALPAKLKSYTSRGIEFRLTTLHIGAANKILPALAAFPESLIITVDDDMYYQARMVSDLVRGWSGDAKEIVCRYGNRIPKDERGMFKSFADWQMVMKDTSPATDIIPFGFGGVLYPPHALSTEVMDTEKLLELAPRADDIWLFWMGRRNGCIYRVVSGLNESAEWPGSQTSALKTTNLVGGNQMYVDNMVAAYGWPI